MFENSQQQSPANKLEGRILQDKWQVGKKLAVGAKGGEGGSGGYFSESYLVTEISTGKTAFLKAFDFYTTLKNSVAENKDVMKVLGELTATYKFEDMLNNICLTKRFKKIVKILDRGQDVADGNFLHVVPYLIMEMAEEGDIRKYVQTSKEINILIKIAYLKDVTLGLNQLHSAKIAHQDLKPSNIMVFSTEGAKIGDLGRASIQGSTQSHDELDVAGDRNYAPPEQLYGYTAPEWIDRRQRCDLYQLGSLICFLFLGVTLNTRLKGIIGKDVAPKFWGGNGDSYTQALPFLDQAFNIVLQDFDTIKPDWLGPRLKNLVKQCSNPNYQLRGSEKVLKMKTPVTGIERFISELDLIKKNLQVRGME